MNFKAGLLVFWFPLVSGNLVFWECPPSVIQKELECVKQMGLQITRPPTYNITRLLDNCKNRRGNESYVCFKEARLACSCSQQVTDIINTGLEFYMENALDYLCSYSQMIEDYRHCFDEMMEKREPYECYKLARDILIDVYENGFEYGNLIQLDRLKSGLCRFAEELSSCHRELTLRSCGSETLASVLGNFWFSSNAEWCE